VHLHSLGARTSLVLGGRSRDSHRSVSAVDTLHLGQGALLLLFAAKPHESITARHSSDWIRHDFGRLARLELVLKQSQEDKLVDVRTEVADEYGILRTPVITAAIGESTSRCPVELEGSANVGDCRSVELKSFGSFIWRLEVNETIASIAPKKLAFSSRVLMAGSPSELVANHLDINLMTHSEPQSSDEVLVNPGLKLAHPDHG
jgi:hypothetical protein